MFVLLEHRTQSGAVHWDFLIEVPGRELLATWRLAENPTQQAGEIIAERIADHRSAFLEYEGPLSADRGSVRRVDRGTATVRRWDNRGLLAELHGELIAGWYEITALDQTVFRRAQRP